MMSQGSHINRDLLLAMHTNLIFKFQSAVYFSVLAMKLLTIVESYFKPKILL